MSKKLVIIMVLILALSVSMDCQTDKQPAEKSKINSWAMPTHMLENLQYMQRIYEIEFNRKVEEYIKILKANFKEYKDMPAGNVIFDFKNGRFLQRDQYQKSQAENQQAIQSAIDADKAKEKKEIKVPGLNP